MAGEYVDHVSGAKESRPVLNRLMTDARQRKFDSVLVWKLGRFGRSLRHLVNAIAEFEALGVALISLSNCPNCPRLTIPIHGFGAFCLCYVYAVKKELSPKQILAVRCPTCGAGPGETCELNTGQPRSEPHRDRELIAAD